MPVVEELKWLVEKLNGIGRPARRDLRRPARPRPPDLLCLHDEGETPNSRLPVLVYRGAPRLDEAFDPAAVFEETFAVHSWRSHLGCKRRSCRPARPSCCQAGILMDVHSALPRIS